MAGGERRQADAGSIDSELIGIVYEAAFDPFFWPDLLEGISELFDDRRHDGRQAASDSSIPFERIRLFSNQLDQSENRRLATLLPHLYRALKLKREYNDTDHSRGQAQAIIEQFPFGVLLVNDRGRLISANQHGLDAIAGSDAIRLEHDVLRITDGAQNRQFKALIDQAANATAGNVGERVSSMQIDGRRGAPLSLLITPDPYPSAPYDRHAERCAAIFIGSASVRQPVSVSALQTLFGLTVAEARLTSLLAGGASLGEAAERSHISKNTARVQLKSIFSKMGVNRQAELIKRVLTSPAVFDPADAGIEGGDADRDGKPLSRVNGEGQLTLADGRRLHYAEYGDPQGWPVIHLHGILGCRYERLPADDLTRRLGVRLIIPDRPGYGLSDHAPDHGYLGVADDLLALVDHLGIRQCSMMGLSVGAIYGSAFAYRAPQRLHRLAMVSATPPFRSFADFAGVPASLKLLIAFSKYLPSAARLIAETAIANACRNPGKFLASVPVCDSDRAIFARSFLQEHIEHCLMSGSGDCHAGFVDDILLSAEPWPFPLQEIRSEVHFWHGTEDSHSPFGRVKPVMDALPDKRVHRIDGGGHFLIYEHWREILGSLLH